MKLKELNHEQRIQVKQKMLDDELQASEGRTPSRGELANADALVTDAALEEYAAGIEFSPDDFPG